jgi:hypothetical protein
VPDDLASTLAGIKERAKAAAAMDVDVLAAFSGISVGGVIAASAIDVSALLAAIEAVLELHQPKPLYGLAFGGLNFDKPLCAHDPDTDHDAHFEGDDGLWYCRGQIAGQACISCAEEDAADLWAEWPCPTHLVITRELTGPQPGKDGSDG